MPRPLFRVIQSPASALPEMKVGVHRCRPSIGLPRRRHPQPACDRAGVVVATPRRRDLLLRSAALAAGLTLLAPYSTQAASSATPLTYKVQVIASPGDKVGDAVINLDGHFWVGGLNDHGQIVFAASSGTGQMLVEYNNGQLTPILVPGQPSPDGVWPPDVGIDNPASINQSGNVVFGVHGRLGTNYPDTNPATNLGTYLWDAATQKLAVVATKGMPAVSNLTFEAGNYWFPTINSQNEIAFPAWVKNAAGKTHLGVFFRGADGQVIPVALPDDSPPGGKVGDAWPAVVNDAGVVALVTQSGSYLWENGALSPVLLAGATPPGGGKISWLDAAWVNNQNHSVLLEAHPSTQSFPYLDSLYLWTNGTLAPVAVPGQMMPGGAQFKGVQASGIQENAGGAVSFPNAGGQHAFVASLKDGSAAAYLMNMDGSLSLILQSESIATLGTVGPVGEGAAVGPSVALNSAGQVAMSVKIAGKGDALVLLTPASP